MAATPGQDPGRTGACVKISVITPTKDRPEAVALCQRWFREQTYPVHEHIIVEGASQLDNIRAGFEEATGDVILVADDDDYYTPDWTRWLAGVYENPKIRAAGLVVRGMHHVRASCSSPRVFPPLIGTLSFRADEAANVFRCMGFDGKPHRVLWGVPCVVADHPYCYRIMGMYPADGPGRGMSRKHNPDRFPDEDRGFRSLRGKIGDKVVDAYLAAVKDIDTRIPPSLATRRLAEFPQYERPRYFGIMREWRQVLVREWLERQFTAVDYLDVGCGPAETRNMAFELGMAWRGCDVVQSVCGSDDVELIPGAHDLSIYRDNQFQIATCNDVMEHILEEDVSSALREIGRVTERAVLLGISQKPGTFHCTIKPNEWWLGQICAAMPGAKATVIYAYRIKPIKKPYLWVSIEW